MDTFAPNPEIADLEKWRGSPIVLAFFPAYWDPARSYRVGLYNELLSRLPTPGKLIAVHQDAYSIDAETEDGQAARITLLQGLSATSSLADSFGVAGREAVFVLDAEGVVRWNHMGPLSRLPTADDLLDALIKKGDPLVVSRRDFVVTAVAVFAALTLLPRIGHAAPAPELVPDAVFRLRVNGKEYSVPGDPRISLLDALRERLGLTGTKKGCDHGQCGACTVHMNGRRVNSCLVLAAQAAGSDVRTIEGLAHGEELHPVQAAFIKHDGFQCGYCTPGQIMSAVSCIEEGHAHNDEEVRDWMSGNICRCGAYVGIVEAIKEAHAKMGGAS